HREGLMRSLAIVFRDEGVEAGLLLQHVRGGRLGRFLFPREGHPFMPAVLLGMAWGDPFQVDAETEPPDRQFTQAIEGMPGGKWQPVVGPNSVWQAEFLKRPLEDRKGEFLLGGRQRLACQQIPAREIRDRERIAVPTIAEQELAFIVRAPERVGFGGAQAGLAADSLAGARGGSDR